MRTQKGKRVSWIKVTEADVQQAVVLMLQLDGWRAIRTDPVSDRARGKGFGEIGMPDYLFIRYRLAEQLRGCGLPLPFPFGEGEAAEVLWIEFKAPGKKPTPHQQRWHNAEIALGALVNWFDSVDYFRKWYKASGLMRNKILS